MENVPAGPRLFISRLTEIVNENLSNSAFGVGELAESYGVSRSRLNRSLFYATGKTAHRFIHEIRLGKAREILLTEDVTAAEVAYRTGFSSPSYFNKCFHEFYGYPPGKVRKTEETRLNGTEKEKSETAPREEKKTLLKKGILILSGVILLIVFLDIAFIVFTGRPLSGANRAGNNLEKSIIILPFINADDSTGYQYFIDGIRDELYNNLSRIHGFRIVSNATADQYRDNPATLPEIAEKLRVNYALTGTWQKSGSTFMLRIRLIEAPTDRQLLATSYNQEIRGTEDIFNFESQIARIIASELNTTISLEDQDRMERVPTTDLTAFDLYLNANSFYKKYIETRDLKTYSRSVSLYKAALELDSSFARAYSDLANVYLRRYFWETYFREDFLDTCEVLADVALRYDPLLAEAWQVKGRCRFENGDVEGALFYYNKSIEVNPEYSDALAYKGYLHTSLVGDFVEGIDSYAKAVMTGPPEHMPELLRGLGQAYLDAGFIDSAKSCFLKAFEFDGNEAEYIYRLADIEYCLENFDEAIRLGNEASKIDSAYHAETSFFYGEGDHVQEAYQQAKRLVTEFRKSGRINLDEAHRIGYAFWNAGKHEEAMEYFETQIRVSLGSIKLKRMISRLKLAHYDLAGTYAFLGNTEMAYQYLDEVDTKNFYPTWWITLIKHDPLFRSIRDQERFRQIVKNMEMKHQAEYERVKGWLEDKKSQRARSSKS